MRKPSKTVKTRNARDSVKRASAMAEYERTQNASAVSRKCKVDRRYVGRWAQRVLVEEGSFEDAHRSGRPRKVGAIETGRLLALVSDQSNRLDSAKELRNELAEDLRHVSVDTVKRTLHREKARYAAPEEQRILTRKHREKRHAFATKYHNGGPWRLCMFTDSCYVVHGQGKRKWVLANEKNIHKYHKKAIKAHVYAGVFFNGRTKLHFATGTTGLKPYSKIARGVGAKEYQESVIPSCFIPAIPYGGHFVQDGAPAHIAKTSQLYIKGWVGDRWISDWPPNSADLNPIENVWKMLKDGVKGVNYEGMPEFKAALENAWSDIPQNKINNCVSSMWRRLRLVTQAKGGPIKY